MADTGNWDYQDLLNTMTPGASHARLGDVLVAALAALSDLQTKYKALLAHLDTANVTGIGNTNAATYGSTVEIVPLGGN